ncbi:MAG: PH domain-containing protein [Nitrososphaerota archaeon]|jgi:uncharacterized membrane protein YdbT with pleckstrin-like domain|nr:PH domain-containing protein [Nitrososphaerota archaeon]MDG6948748.1 PH domain-containing protein [Nitrososphaerota archaeon]
MSSEAPLTVRPALTPAAFSAGILAASLFFVSLGIAYLVHIPPVEQYAVATLLGFLFLGLLAVAIWRDIVAYATQSYVIGNDIVKINVGFALKQSKSIDRTNIASVDCVLPFPARIFGIGSVTINTTDGYSETMLNVRNPSDIAKHIEPRASGASSRDTVDHHLTTMAPASSPATV